MKNTFYIEGGASVDRCIDPSNRAVRVSFPALIAGTFRSLMFLSRMSALSEILALEYLKSNVSVTYRNSGLLIRKCLSGLSVIRGSLTTL